jgi:GNAT superfamily N-acetyltransferase
MRPGDIDAVVEIARLSFPDHFESRSCFENRLALYPRGCFVLAAEGEPAKAYLIAYPWKTESAPPLNTVVEGLPADPALIYLHDLALHPDVRGGGHTATVVERLMDQAAEDGWPIMALVAVNDAVAFWSRHGFVEQPAEGMAAKLASYGSDARYMIRSL